MDENYKEEDECIEFSTFPRAKSTIFPQSQRRSKVLMKGQIYSTKFISHHMDRPIFLDNPPYLGSQRWSTFPFYVEVTHTFLSLI